MKRQIILAALLVCGASTAWSQPSAPEALPGGYPDPQCTKPRLSLVKPQVQPGGSGNAVDSGAVGAYNARAKGFNRDAAAYNSCMQAYIESANRDLKIIGDKANADLKQLTERDNASMKAIRDKIDQAVAAANDVSAALDRDTAKLRK